MIRWGLSYGHHDAAIVVMYNNEIVIAERAHAKDLNDDRLKELELSHPPDRIYIHENKRRDLWRKIKSRDWSRLFEKKPYLPKKPVYGNHHLSHAATGYYTSGFRDALVVVADAIGEQESLAVYRAYDRRLDTTPIFTLKYPSSLGLYYSYHTAMVGLKPNRDEYKLMKMSNESMYRNYPLALFSVHTNYHLYPKTIVADPVEQRWIAATVQHQLEGQLIKVVEKFSDGRRVNLVFAGGVAYNRKLCEKLKFNVNDLYVPSHPGDAGSALGAILQHTHQRVVLENGRIFNEKTS
jgi:carbamoyltransferase